ncbi:hypothetical protein [Kribbella italica]|uniref:Uncharacterized protein n=1 Tax=Kribbella italica TaxID=1540520 RepID=A0A7W9JE64_9ACTN|nr:hypothetical protein [Kribbella italica]MBB5840506.1 hypothetical protein [Kribbella italica]
MSAYPPNDGRFPNDTTVWTPYPLTEEENTLTACLDGSWPWLLGTVLGQCGPDEWHIVIDVPELIEHGDGYDWSPACFRNSCQLRRTGRSD